jgi:AraC-like DNA-binding protein
MKIKNILRCATGQFDKRHVVGPSTWPHFDLLWIHRGAVELKIGDISEPVVLNSPTGVLITPNTSFNGKVITPFALASICHFEAVKHDAASFASPNPDECPALQSMIELLHRNAARQMETSVQKHLLRSIIECFLSTSIPQHHSGKVLRAWTIAAQNLQGIRTLTDVAAIVGMSESGFRALHRKAFPSSAGRHLLTLRMNEAARLLGASGDTVSQIARLVGYTHPESFSHAFAKFYGTAPRDYRERADRFA